MTEHSEIRNRILALRHCQRKVRSAEDHVKRKVLIELEQRLGVHEAKILEANAVDLGHARKSGKAPAFIDRLTLTHERIQGMRESLRQVAALPNPVGEEVERRTLPNGIKVRKLRAPLGVLFIIFESRPNVAIEAFALSFKSGNLCVLRGGKESQETLTVLYQLIGESLVASELQAESFYGVTDPDRGLLQSLLKEKTLFDVVIPRGGDALIEFVVEHSRIPLIKNDRGLCHLYVHEKADLEMAQAILLNSKTQRPGVCNAVETLLIDRKIAPLALPLLYQALVPKRVMWFACPESEPILSGVKNPISPVSAANESSFDTEYLDLKLNVRIVNHVHDAIEHIEFHGSRHSEAIVTADPHVAKQFQEEIDAAAVYWNASTRFTDGFELGLGGEIGISTQKLHVRGPVGLKELTSVRWVFDGQGQTRGSS